jgi:ribonuclease HI
LESGPPLSYPSNDTALVRQRFRAGRIACYAFIIKDDKNTIHSEYGLAAYDSTNNVAEYTAGCNLEYIMKKQKGGSIIQTLNAV